MHNENGTPQALPARLFIPDIDVIETEHKDTMETAELAFYFTDEGLIIDLVSVDGDVIRTFSRTFQEIADQLLT